MNVSEGDVFLLSSENKQAVAKVIYASEYFKDVILIKLYLKSIKKEDIPNTYEVDADFKLLYTGKDSAKKGKWEFLANQEVSDSEIVLSRRIVGGDVWLGDEHLGPATDDDIKHLPKMLTMGFKLIDKNVARL